MEQVIIEPTVLCIIKAAVREPQGVYKRESKRRIVGRDEIDDLERYDR
jgi:hypothetical protein